MHSKNYSAAVLGRNTNRHDLSKKNICLSFFDVIWQFSRCSPGITVGTEKSKELPTSLKYRPSVFSVPNLAKTF